MDKAMPMTIITINDATNFYNKNYYKKIYYNLSHEEPFLLHNIVQILGDGR